MAEKSDVRGCMVIKPWGYGLWENMQRDARWHVQGDRPQERLLPALHPAELPREGGRARRGLRQGMRGRHASPARGRARRRLASGAFGRARRAARRAADQRDDHRRDLREVGAVVPRSADPHQPVGQRRPLGNAPARLPAHHRISLAGRPHRARDRGGGARGDRAACSASTRPSRAITWRCPSSPARRARASASPARCRRSASRRWCRIARPSRPAPRISSARISPRRAASSFSRGRTRRSTRGPRAGASARGSSAPSSWRTATTTARSCRRASRRRRSSSCPSRRRRRRAAAVLEAVEQLARQLARAALSAASRSAWRSTARDLGGGEKNWEWIKKGVPLRVEIGPRDLEKGTVAVARRDRAPEGEELPDRRGVRRTSARRSCNRSRTSSSRAPPRSATQHTCKIDSKEEFYAFFTAEECRRSRRSTAASRSPTGTARARSRTRSRKTSRSPSAASRSTENPEAGRCIITGEPSRAAGGVCEELLRAARVDRRGRRPPYFRRSRLSVSSVLNLRTHSRSFERESLRLLTYSCWLARSRRARSAHCCCVRWPASTGTL